MNAPRRSYLFHIAILCLAVFCSRTACAARPIEQLLATTPCQNKVAAEPPAAQKKFSAQIKKAPRPQRASAFRLISFHAAFVAQRGAALALAQEQQQALRSNANLTVPAQYRLFALRV